MLIMKNKSIISLLFLIFLGCSAESQPEPESENSPDAAVETEERQTFPTPSNSENVRNAGCVSVVYVKGRKEVFPCAQKPVPHGPIYENK